VSVVRDDTQGTRSGRLEDPDLGDGAGPPAAAAAELVGGPVLATPVVA
jgi:hypothetical protein